MSKQKARGTRGSREAAELNRIYLCKPSKDTPRVEVPAPPKKFIIRRRAEKVEASNESE